MIIFLNEKNENKHLLKYTFIEASLIYLVYI